MKRKKNGQFNKNFNARLGKKHSEETKKKMREFRKKVVITDEWKSNLSKSRMGNKNAKGFRHSPEWILNLKEKNRGNKYNYQEGLTSLNQLIRTSVEYKLWRNSVFERDNYQCIWGGKEHGSILEADHIKSFSQYPELRFAIDNGRTLCKECHKTTDTYAGKNKKKK